MKIIPILIILFLSLFSIDLSAQHEETESVVDSLRWELGFNPMFLIKISQNHPLVLKYRIKQQYIRLTLDPNITVTNTNFQRLYGLGRHSKQSEEEWILDKGFILRGSLGLEYRSVGKKFAFIRGGFIALERVNVRDLNVTRGSGGRPDGSNEIRFIGRTDYWGIGAGLFLGAQYRIGHRFLLFTESHLEYMQKRYDKYYTAMYDLTIGEEVGKVFDPGKVREDILEFMPFRVLGISYSF